MTINEFISLTKNDAKLMKALDEERPEGLQAIVEFAKRHGFSIDPEEMDDSALFDVTGGHFAAAFDMPKSDICRHTGCDGQIMNVGDPFHDCECSKCHETHYWLWSFDYYVDE